MGYLCTVIEYSRYTLSNGLRVIHHHDPLSTTVVLNILYNVGARDEESDRTGFAHLFEHLMFGGSLHIPEYDKAVEAAGGSNNAFTNNDFTNYYITVPAENAETAFWLESDRMLQLAFSEKSLDVQRGVVLEEFRQRCFNAPFGQLWHHVRSLLYTRHPYRWPTIGRELRHIEEATLSDVETFYYRHYHPANAILCVAGNISPEETRNLCEKWFGSIERSGIVNLNQYPSEPVQAERRFMQAQDLSPNNAVFMAWRCPGYSDNRSRGFEVFAEMLGGTETSPLHMKLVKETGKFNAAESFCMRSLDDSIFMVYGLLNDGISHSEAEHALTDILNNYCQAGAFTQKQFDAVKNRVRAHKLFDNTSLMNVAQQLCFYELTGDAELINTELKCYQDLIPEEILSQAAATFKPENASVIYYTPYS